MDSENAESGSVNPIEPLQIEFSGTSCEESEWHAAWLAFTDREYYHRCRQIMLDYGMGGGDVEMILANFWECGWIAAKHHHAGPDAPPRYPTL